jgi:hypothetical protein
MDCAFHNTKLIVEMFGGSQFTNELSEEWGWGCFEKLMVQYMERYCCEYCDSLITPDPGIIEWAPNARWSLCKDIIIKPFEFRDIKITDSIDRSVELDKQVPLFFLVRLVKQAGCTSLLMYFNVLPQRNRK